MTKVKGKLKPTTKQLSFLDWELGLFLHFGIRTFYEGYKDWDGKEMDPILFDPTELNCEQWIETAYKAGFKYAILTAKHHDGFANWPTEYSKYAIKASPWKDGKGDVVREFVEACAKFNMKVGIYYSPADYTIQKSEWGAKEYDDYFLNQVSELLTGYGDIDIIWFDGCGSEEHEYDWQRIIGEIRRLQPGIRIFNMGDPDIRWIGNEAGMAPLDNWNEVDSVPFSVLTDKKEKLNSNNMTWLPGECDCKMRLDNWFYSENDEDTVKSVSELMGLYYYSVGRGANFLLNIGPDRRGLLPDNDAKNLVEFGEEVRRRFSKPLASLENFKRENNRFTFSVEKPLLVDHAVITENMVEGQSIKKFSIYVKPYAGDQEICVYEGKTIGHKVICKFPSIMLSKCIVEIEQSEGPYLIDNIKLFHITD